jgi:multiple sugar transport system permease protein
MIGSMQGTARPRASWWRRFRRSEMLPGLLFISPWIIGFCCFQIYPIISSMYYSFTSYNMMLPPIPVGFTNYTNLFTHDDLFWKSLGNTAIYAVISVPLGLIVSFIFAVLLNRNIPGRPVFRTAFYFPNVVPSVATAILWTMMLSSQGGLVNTFLGFFGISSIPWLAAPEWAMPSLILVSLWGIGATVVIFLAGLQDVPRTLYEAAQIDGAGSWSLMRHVTIPMISPVILFNLVIGIINGFQVFAQPFIIFGAGTNSDGGGPLDSVLMYSVQLFTQAFKYFNMGYAAAMAWILFVIIFTLTLISMRLSSRFVHYD